MSKPGHFYLLNYELHSDSSDFESTKGTTNTSQDTNTKSGRSMETIYPKRKRDLKLSLTGNSSKETYESVTTTISQNGSIGIIEVEKSYKKKKSKIYTACGDQVKTMKSKHSVIRHKVMPCLSNIFRRTSNNVKDNMSIIKENPSENTMVDNGCQTTHDVEQKTKKRNARQKNYVIQPVYAVEGNIHAKSSQCHHKSTRESSPTCKTRNKKVNNNYNITSSSEEVETHKFCKRKKVKRSKFKRGACKEKENIERCEEQQFPSKTIQQTPPYHIYTSPCQYQYKNRGCSPITYNALKNGVNLSPTCSGFWEYIVNKMGTKSKRGTIKNLEGSTNTPPFKSCECEDDIAQKANPSNSSVCHANCCYAHSNAPSCCPSPHNIQNNQMSSSCCSSLPRSPPKTKPVVKNTKLSKNKIDCKCPPKQEINCCPSPVCVKANTPPCQHDHDKITASLSSKYNGEVLCIHNPPCVLINGCLNLPPPKLETTTDLYSVTTDLKNNYPDAYAQFMKSHNRHKHYYQPEAEMEQSKIVDASCQYFLPTKEIKSGISYKIPGNHHTSPSDGRKPQTATMPKSQPREIDADNRQHQTTSIERSHVWSPYENKKEQMPSYESSQRRQSIYGPKQLITSDESHEELQSEIETRPVMVQKQEKMVQSICNHNPPCEVVRTCCKPKYNAKFQNSCVHVPMCDRVPLCLMDLKDRNEKDRNGTVKCSHSPRCAEVPVCTRNYIVLTAKEEAATQARPRTNHMVCRHEPPCIMIPLCLARVCDSYIPYDAIPDCVHQPMCEMIPACCRKSAKAMVSVRSQCPSQCCIV